MLFKLKQEQLREELELETQQRLLKAKNEVQLAKLEMELNDAVDSRFDNVVNHDGMITISDNLKECKMTESNVHVSDIQRETAACIKCHTDKIDLPKVELQYFHGNPTNYWKFIRQFGNYIESRLVDEGQRLLYLVNYCKGKAKAGKEECCLLPVDLGYKTAREI